MAETIYIRPEADKEEKYKELMPQLAALVGSETDEVANMANLSAALKQAFGFFWVGFYRVVGEELVLGPFQGPVACTRIKYGRGVCGTAWKEKVTQVVPDVHLFLGHIACSSLSESEIVVPVFDDRNEVVAVLDIDSREKNTFDETDRLYLERAVKFLPWASSEAVGERE